MPQCESFPTGLVVAQRSAFRVRSGSPRVPDACPLWIGELFLLGVLVAGSAMIFSVAFSEPAVDTAESVVREARTQPVEGVAFSPDGKTLATCGWDNTVRVWDISRLSEGPPSQPVVLPHGSVRYALAFSADGALLAAAGEKSVTIWTCKSGHYTPLLEEVCETSRCVAFSADGRTLGDRD